MLSGEGRLKLQQSILVNQIRISASMQASFVTVKNEVTPFVLEVVLDLFADKSVSLACYPW